MKTKFLIAVLFFFCFSSSAWAKITDVDIVGYKEGSVVNLDIVSNFPSVCVAASVDETTQINTSGSNVQQPKAGPAPKKSQLVTSTPYAEIVRVTPDNKETTLNYVFFLNTKVANIFTGCIPSIAASDFALNDSLYFVVNDSVTKEKFPTEKIRIGAKSIMTLTQETENLKIEVRDDDEVDQGREHSIPIIAFKPQGNSIPMLLDMEDALLSQTQTETGYNFQANLPQGVGERSSGKSIYDILAAAFHFEEILAAIEDTKTDLNSPDAKAGPAMLEFNTFLMTTLHLPSVDYATIVNLLLESIDAFVASTGSQVAIDAWNAIRAQLVASLNTEGGQYYVTSLYYGITKNSFTSIEEGGMGQSLGDFLKDAFTALSTPSQGKEALKQVFAPLNENLKAKFLSELDQLAKSITYDPMNPDNINSYALLRGLINKVVIDIIELIPADDIYTTLLSLASDCQSKNDTAVTVPSTQVTSPIGSQTTQPAEKCDADPRLPGLYLYLTTTTETHEQIKERVIAFLETVVDLLADVHNFSDIIAKVVSRIESGEYTTDEVIDFLLKFGLIKEAPMDKDAFIASVIKTLNARY